MQLYKTQEIKTLKIFSAYQLRAGATLESKEPPSFSFFCSHQRGWEELKTHSRILLEQTGHWCLEKGAATAKSQVEFQRLWKFMRKNSQTSLTLKSYRNVNLNTSCFYKTNWSSDITFLANQTLSDKSNSRPSFLEHIYTNYLKIFNI